MKQIIFIAIMLTSSLSFAASVAVIDMEIIVQATSEGKKAKNKIEAEYAKNKTLFSKKEKALQAESKAYESKKESYSDEVQMEKEQALGKKMAEFEQELQDSEKKIQEMSEALTKPIIKKIRTAVSKVSNAKGYTVVFERTSPDVFWVNDSVDITDDVIKVVKH